jgi:toxin-antitoxin system PIN domain toxin
MSSTVDVNVLVGAANRDDPHHDACRTLVERLAAGPELWHLFWPVISGYVRITTSPRILQRPDTVRSALESVRLLLASPSVRVHGELDGFYAWFVAAQAEATGGNDVPGAHLVALMRQHGVATIYTRDRGFRRFDGVTVRDPAKSQPG